MNVDITPWNSPLVCTLWVDARNELDWISMSLPGWSVNDPMSPGAGGARLIQPPLGPPLTVLMKMDSRAIMRFMPASSPLAAELVVSSTPAWATMAPGSALMVSPGASWTVSRAYVGANSMSVFKVSLGGLSSLPGVSDAKWCDGHNLTNYEYWNRSFGIWFEGLREA